MNFGYVDAERVRAGAAAWPCVGGGVRDRRAIALLTAGRLVPAGGGGGPAAPWGAVAP